MLHLCWEAMKILDPLDLTRRLVDIESTTYNEGAVGDFLDGFLQERGFTTERTPVPQPPISAYSGPRFNVYAHYGKKPDVVFSTHIDTVPPFIPSSEDDLFLYGRGTCDAKGILAAQVAAVERLRDAGLATAALFVVGEERDSAGAKVANNHAKGSRFLINGEPTDNRLALASKGTLRAEIRAHGKMAHSAYPELGENAIHKLIEALHRILAIDLPFVEGIGPSTLNIGLIEGGRAPNVISDRGVGQVMVRLVGPSDETRKAILNAVGDLAEVEFTLEIPFVRMRQVEGLDTMVAAFTTDIPALTNWGEPLLLGPGSIHVAHTPNEKIAKSELLQAVDLYYDLGKRLAAS
jgi:acetylornithine deacetylase